jgi:hypothetical protein
VIKGIAIGFVLAITISAGSVFPSRISRAGGQTAVRLVSRISRTVNHRLCDNDVSETAAIVPWHGRY